MTYKRYCLRCGREHSTYNAYCEFCTQNDIIEQQARLDREAADRRATEDRNHQLEQQRKLDNQRRMEYYRNYIPTLEETEADRRSAEIMRRHREEMARPKTTKEKLNNAFQSLVAWLVQAVAVIAIVGSPLWVAILLFYWLFVTK